MGTPGFPPTRPRPDGPVRLLRPVPTTPESRSSHDRHHEQHRAAAVGGRVAAVLQPDVGALVRRLRGGVRPARRRAGRGRHVRAAVRRQAAQQLPRAVRPRRRRPGRGPHVHLLRARDRRRSHQQLAGPRRDEGRAARPLPRRHAGPHDVRGAVLDGPARLAHRPHRRAAHRLALRRGQHADHDPHGPGRPRRARRRRRVRPVRALGRLPARRCRRQRPARRAVAVRRREQVHRPLPRDPRDLVLRLGLRRQRPARQEVLRPAHRLDDGPRRRLDGRAHAHPRHHAPRTARSATSPPRSRRRAARRTWPCSSRRCRAGRSRPSATTSPG